MYVRNVYIHTCIMCTSQSVYSPLKYKIIIIIIMKKEEEDEVEKNVKKNNLFLLQFEYQSKVHRERV